MANMAPLEITTTPVDLVAHYSLEVGKTYVIQNDHFHRKMRIGESTTLPATTSAADAVGAFLMQPYEYKMLKVETGLKIIAYIHSSTTRLQIAEVIE